MSMTHDEMIAVIQAAKDGKQIEMYAHSARDGIWCKPYSKLFDFTNFDFRVRPEPPKPREFWITVYEGQLSSTWKHPVEKYSADEVIHVREVLE